MTCYWAALNEYGTFAGEGSPLPPLWIVTPKSFGKTNVAFTGVGGDLTFAAVVVRRVMVPVFIDVTSERYLDEHPATRVRAFAL